MKQTSTEWLFEQLWETPKDKFDWDYLLKQAKLIEKEQIADAYYTGDKNGCGCYDYCTQEDAINYYKETYGE